MALWILAFSRNIRVEKHSKIIFMKNLFKSIKSNVVQIRSDENKLGRLERRRAMAELRGLSDAQLKDIGITRGDINYTVKHGRDAA